MIRIGKSFSMFQNGFKLKARPDHKMLNDTNINFPVRRKQNRKKVLRTNDIGINISNCQAPTLWLIIAFLFYYLPLSCDTQ